MKRRTIAAGAVPIAAAVSLTACGNIQSSSFQNTAVNRTYNPTAIRLDTPGHFPAIIRICDGTTAVYDVGEGGAGVALEEHAPECAGRKPYAP